MLEVFMIYHSIIMNISFKSLSSMYWSLVKQLRACFWCFFLILQQSYGYLLSLCVCVCLFLRQLLSFQMGRYVVFSFWIAFLNCFLSAVAWCGKLNAIACASETCAGIPRLGLWFPSLYIISEHCNLMHLDIKNCPVFPLKDEENVQIFNVKFDVIKFSIYHFISLHVLFYSYYF